MADYELLRFSLPEDLEEPFVAELWSLGALGFEIREADPGRVRIDAYFPSPLPAALEDPLERWGHRGVQRVTSERVADRDWLASYRQSAEPFDVGRMFRVDPGDARIDPGDPSDLSDVSDPSGPSATSDSRFVLRIPAQTAFGTGSHESTRLVLEWLEELDLTNLAILDVGTGSGILAFAAEHLGAGRIVAFDVDAPAVCIARSNARLNASTACRFFAGGIAALRDAPRFELLLVNILPENFAGEIPGLARVLEPGGRLISSGNLAERRDQLLARWQRHGFVLEAERRQDEWIAFLLAFPEVGST